ncbi:MAG: asparagine synthase-related protein [Rhodospirillales bacterium]
MPPPLPAISAPSIPSSIYRRRTRWRWCRDFPRSTTSRSPIRRNCRRFSRLARQQVTVVLTGDGGDELFAGYSAYPRCLKQWNTWRKVPAPAGATVWPIWPRSPWAAPWLAGGSLRSGGRRVRKLAAKLAGRAARMGATLAEMLAAGAAAPASASQTLVPGKQGAAHRAHRCRPHRLGR